MKIAPLPVGEGWGEGQVIFKREANMEKQILPGLKITFLLHALVALVIGIGLYLIPETVAAWVNWTPVDVTMARFYGAAILALGLSSWFGYRAVHWDHVRIVVEMEIAFTVLGILAGLYEVLFAGAPAFAWVSILIWLIFAAAFTYFYRADEAALSTPLSTPKSA